MMADLAQLLADNLRVVRQRIADGLRRSGRGAEAVELVAVTKYVTANIARQLAQLGCLALGESRPQSLWQKAAALQDLPVRWHMIGHLQRNKIRRTLPVLACLHSADSTRLLDALNDEAKLAGHRLPVLLEVDISREEEKTGFFPEEVLPLAEQLAHWDGLRICGLMAMSGRSSSADQVRQEFARVRQLRDHLQTLCPPGITLEHLSMGMSDDYEIAVEEGATMVRVGSALFAGVSE